MISNNSNQSDIYPTKTEWFKVFGSSYTTDFIFLFITTPISLIGFILNIISCAILSKRAFEKCAVYSYMRMYSFNSIFVNLVSVYLFTANCFTFFEFTYSSTIPSYYISFVYVPLVNFCMFFAILMEIIISIERISQISLRFRHFVTYYKPRTIGIATIIGCIVINVQYFLTEQPSYAVLNLNSTTSFRLNSPHFTSFTMSLTGIIMNFSTYFFRDVVLLVVQCILAIVSISLLKKYFKNKKNVLNRLPPPQSEIGYSHNSLTSNITNIFQLNSSTIRNNISKNDHKLTLMIVVMSLLSVIEHFLFLAFVIMLTYFLSDTAFIIITLAQFYLSFKHFLNFFLLFSFNNLFKKETKKSFGFN